LFEETRKIQSRSYQVLHKPNSGGTGISSFQRHHTPSILKHQSCNSSPNFFFVAQDLKADNILVEPTGVCKISDFGISKKADIHRGRAFTGMKGTVFWMAPEILYSDGKGYDVKVDIWSVGCIVLEMWTGDRPWSGEELVPVMMKVFFMVLIPLVCTQCR
jgi:serine/threonine protein kinase